jgi:hypothetical protein
VALNDNNTKKYGNIGSIKKVDNEIKLKLKNKNLKYVPKQLKIE